MTGQSKHTNNGKKKVAKRQRGQVKQRSRRDRWSVSTSRKVWMRCRASWSQGHDQIGSEGDGKGKKDKDKHKDKCKIHQARAIHGYDHDHDVGGIELNAIDISSFDGQFIKCNDDTLMYPISGTSEGGDRNDR